MPFRAGPNARSTAVNRILGGEPPAAAQFNTGAQFVELAENGLLRDLTPFADADDWAHLMPAKALASSTLDGHVWALPISANGANWFWFSKKALDQLGLETPTTWEDTFLALDKAKEAGLIPLALSGEPRWERLLFNAVVLGVAGSEVYSEVVDDRNADAVRGAEFRKAVEVYARLRDYVDAGAPGRPWPDAASLVMKNEALMTQGGTWFNGAFAAAGLEAGADYDCAIIEPEQGMVISGDVFLFPKVNDANEAKAQELLVKAFSDPDTQAGFAKANGTIPILQGADTSGLSACIVKASTFFSDPALGASSDQAVYSPAVVGAVQDAITRFWNRGGLDIDQFIEAYATGLVAE